MDLRLSDATTGCELSIFKGRCVCVCKKERVTRAAPCRCERADANSPPRAVEPSAASLPVFGIGCARPSLNSANLLPTLLDLRSITSVTHPRPTTPDSTRTLAPSRRSKLTRNDFDLAANRLLAAHHQQQQLDHTSFEHASLEQRRYPLATGWEWHVGPGSKWTPGIGHLRQHNFGVRLLRPSTPVAEQDASLTPTTDWTDSDSSALDSGALADTDIAETCSVRLSICYSPSYGVPVLWLEAHKRDGAPLSLTEIMRSSIFIDGRLGDELTPEEQVAADGNHSSTTSPVLLSRADHPATGQFCWFLHPCETEAMVNEILEASQEEAGTAAPSESAPQPTHGRDSPTLGGALEWLEAWVMVIGGVVDLQP